MARPIVDNLKSKGLLFKSEQYSHRYPHCWRCRTELVFRLVDEWYISMRDLRPMLMKVSRDIRWLPDFGLERELDWLRNMHDWMISKKRYWGLALPIWYCEACNAFEVIGGREELQERAVAGYAEFEGHSPHRPWVDAIKIACSKCGAAITRIPDVGNPVARRGHRAVFDDALPHRSVLFRALDAGDFITESFPGQYRNWFYSLLVMSTVLESKPPFKTVLGFATLRDEKGQPMHKSLGNAIASTMPPTGRRRRHALDLRDAEPGREPELRLEARRRDQAPPDEAVGELQVLRPVLLARGLASVEYGPSPSAPSSIGGCCRA